jgi:hypothetical protein
MSTEDHPGSAGPWHVKREIQLGHIITTLTIAVSVVVYVGKQDQRIALIEQQLNHQSERDQRQDVDASNALKVVREDIRGLGDKLDRLYERSKR